MNGAPLDPKTTSWEDIVPQLPKGGGGYSAKEVFEDTSGRFAYTYDDLILMPGK